jgi:hypothetical protein
MAVNVAVTQWQTVGFADVGVRVADNLLIT